MPPNKIIVIIPARGGSKGIPRKNLLAFCGKPLLAWSILQAREAARVSEIYVSSDDDEILDVATGYGALGIKRPTELSGDTCTSEEALVHALSAIEKQRGERPDLIVFLQATSVLREPEDIDGAVSKLLDQQADSLFSVAVLDDFCVWRKSEGTYKGLTFDPENRGRRQDRPPLYLENGSIYVFHPRVLLDGNNRTGGKIAIFEMPYWKSYEIDTHEQVEICEYYFKKNLLARWSSGPANRLGLSSIDLIVYDFDGVLTDNRVIVFQDGTEAVTATRADGLGIDMLRSRGIPQLILSTETNPVVRARARKLRLNVIDCCTDKRKALEEYCVSNGYALERVMYIGNDINDLEPMKIVGIPVAPADAHPEVKAVSTIITHSRGGMGVIKEVADLLLNADI